METYKIRKLIEAGFTDEQIDNIQKIIVSPEVPQATNRLPITKEDVGRNVRMSDGTINRIENYLPNAEIDLERKVDGKYYTFTADGRHWAGSTEIKIVEVLR